MPKQLSKNYDQLIRDELAAMQSIVKVAEDAGRDLSTDEETAFNSSKTKIDGLKNAYTREKVLIDTENSLDPANPIPFDVLPLPPGQPKNQIKVGNDRAAGSKWANMGDFFLAVKNAGDPNPTVDNRLIQNESPRNASGMSVSVQGDGGFMVGSEVESWLMKAIEDNAIIFPMIEKLPVGKNRNSLTLPALAETSRADGSRFGGVTAHWTPEAGTADASKPALREIDIKLAKLLAFCHLTEELMADSNQIQAFVRKAFGEEMAYQLDNAIVNGDGNGKPLGILNSRALISVAKESGQKADTIVCENILKMWSRLGARHRMSAAWLINQEIEPELFTMAMPVGTGGVPVYMPANGISGKPYSTLLGRPVFAVEQCSKLGDKGDIILANLKDYIGIDKGGLDVDSSIHVKFLYDESSFRFRYRFNGTPYTNVPLTSAKNAAFSTGPYVTLDAR